MNRASSGTNGKREGGWDEGNTRGECGVKGMQERRVEWREGRRGWNGGNTGEKGGMEGIQERRVEWREYRRN